jgi:DNA-binding response OmpR family regulator
MASQALAASPQTTAALAAPAHAGIPTVMIVDSDPEVVAHCARMLDDLNYPHVGAPSAREALDVLVRDPRIEIVVACAHLPLVDAFMLIEEARARVGQTRPLAFVAMTDRMTTEIALRSLHFEAADLLSKPPAFEEWSLALRRASRYLGARRRNSDDAALSSFGQQLGQLMAMLETVRPAREGDSLPTDQEIAATLRAIIGARALRNRYFPSQIFADPAWDILLDLTRAKLEGQQVSVSSVCIAASVPMSTALRWVKQMTDANLLRRWTDPKDRRRDLIALTEPTADRMREYLATVHKSFAAL